MREKSQRTGFVRLAAGSCASPGLHLSVTNRGFGKGVTPLTLRTFHLAFILLAIMGADLFGGWAVSEYGTSGDVVILALGIACVLGGLGLAVYSIRVVRMMDRAGIH